MTASPPNTPATAAVAVSRTTNVYVVDDDEGVRNSLAALLLVGGHAPRTFASGPEFLAALRALRGEQVAGGAANVR